MDAAPIVTLIAVGLAIAVIAAFLITVVYQLYQVYSRINDILGAVGQVIEKTAVLDPVISEIKADLAGGQEAIEDSVERLKSRKGYSEQAERERAAQHEYLPVGAGAAATQESQPGQTPTSYTNY